MLGYIYITTNIINGMQYVGQSIQQKAYKKKNYLGSGTYLMNVIKKHGRENFKREILIDNIECIAALNIYEYIFIKKYNTLKPNGYNIEAFGRSCGHRQKETLDKISKANKGRVHSWETRQLISDNRKGKNEGANNHFYGKSHTIEARLRISETHKNKKISQDSIIKREATRKLIDYVWKYWKYPTKDLHKMFQPVFLR